MTNAMKLVLACVLIPIYVWGRIEEDWTQGNHYVAKEKTTINFMTEEKPTIDFMTEEKPTINFMAEPTINFMTEEKPTINFMTEEKPTINFMTEEKPTINFMTEVKPTINFMTEEKPTINFMTEVKPTINFMTEVKPTINFMTEEKPTRDILGNKLPTEHKSMRKPLRASFSWTTCGSPSESAKISDLSVVQTGDETFRVKARGSLARDVAAPIKGQLQMWRKMAWGWAAVPCIQGVGTCSYADLCQFFQQHNTDCSMDSEFGLQRLPCSCPIRQGVYGGTMNINMQFLKVPSWMKKGQFRVKGTIADRHGEIICINMEVIVR